MSRRERGWILVLVLCVAGPATAQDRDPDRDAADGTTHRRYKSLKLPSDEETKKAPPSIYDPSDEAPPPDSFDAPPNPPGSSPRPADPKARAAAEATTEEEEIEVQATGRVRLGLGYDSNVFRAERGRKSDGFFHGQGEADVLVKFPGERELYANVTGEGTSYFHDSIADEAYGSMFVDYYHPIWKLLDVDVQNTFEYSSQNLLDDNGDLLPRAKFRAYDDEARGAFIVHASEDLSLELGGGYRIKHFEDTPGLPSLDYDEARGSAGVRYKVPFWPDGKVKVRYVYRDRQYRELSANFRDGTTQLGNPDVRLRRHQALATFSQKVDLFGTKLTGQIGYSFTYNDDVFQSDRSYREHAGSVRVEWWLIPDWTRVDGEVRLGARNFLVRRTLLGEQLKQRYADLSLTLYQKVYDHVALVGELGYYIYRSSDIRSSYDRLLVQLGIEGSF